MSKQIQKGLSLFLLAVVLATQVGLHLFHHHNSSNHSHHELSIQADSDQHCSICGLDLFLAQELPSEFHFSFTATHVSKLHTPATSAISYSILFTSGRAPPVC
jgi:hypothetical protein